MSLFDSHTLMSITSLNSTEQLVLCGVGIGIIVILLLIATIMVTDNKRRK